MVIDVIYNNTDKSVANTEFDKPTFINGKQVHIENKLYFNYRKDKHTLIITPSMTLHDHRYEWYINDKLYSNSKTIALLPDSYDINIRLLIKNELEEIVYENTDSIYLPTFFDNNGSYMSRTFSDAKFTVIKDASDEKIFKLSGNSTLIDGKFVITTNMSPTEIKKHYIKTYSIVETTDEEENTIYVKEYDDFTLESLANNLWRATNFTNDFGVYLKELELWFNIKSQYKIKFANWLIRDYIPMSEDTRLINMYMFFYDALQSIHLLDRGCPFAITNTVFNIYSDKILLDTSDDTPDTEYYTIEDVKFGTDGTTDTPTYTFDFDPMLWTHNGYVLHASGYAEVCADGITSFKHKDVIFENVQTIRVHNDTDKCITVFRLDDENWVPVLIPPTPIFTAVDKIKVSDKISIEGINLIKFEYENAVKFKTPSHVYFKPGIPGCTVISQIIAEKSDGSILHDENIVIATNETFSCTGNAVYVTNNNDHIVIDDKIYSVNSDILVKHDGIELVEGATATVCTTGFTALDETHHYETNRFSINPIDTDVIAVNDIFSTKLIYEEMFKQNMRIFNYTNIFYKYCKIQAEMPLCTPFLQYLDCSYRVVEPTFTRNQKTYSGRYDARLMVV